MARLLVWHADQSEYSCYRVINLLEPINFAIKKSMLETCFLRVAKFALGKNREAKSIFFGNSIENKK